ncbi:MAG: ParA family protein [Betaproteobacteria bacterium]|nr:MAG: ParA family protein [Betaproteobacteria bacterium]
MSATQVLAVVNQKGGVGKTTTSVNLAAAFAKAGRRVLLIDLDPQGNATMGSGIDKRAAPRTVYHVLLGLSELAAARVRSEQGGFDLVPANRELAGAEVELGELPGRESRLKSALERFIAEYDFVLIDCPPSLSLLTVNALTAAQRVLIPMQCEYYALEGLSDLVATIKRVRAHLNPHLEIAGLLRTMYDPRNTLSQQVSQQLEAPSYGVPAVLWDATSKGAQAYLALASEILGGAACRQKDSDAGSMRCSAAMSRRAKRSRRSRRCRSAPGDTSRVPAWTSSRSPSLRNRFARKGCCSRLSCARSIAATSSSPASGAGARRSWRGSTRCRSSCARCPTRRRSSWR